MKLTHGIGLITLLCCTQTWAEGTGTAAPAATSNAASSYMRTVENPTDGTVSLQFASRHLVPVSGKGTGIWLVGTGHMALKSYYQETQAFLDTIPLVLCEDVGVNAPTNTVENPSAQRAAEAQAMRERRSMIPVMARRHGLVAQPEGIDYSRPNMEFCDLTHAEVMDLLEKSMGRRLQPDMMSPDKMPRPHPVMPDAETKAVLDKLTPSEITQQMIGRLMMIESSGEASFAPPELPGMKGFNDVIVGERNAHLLAKIKAQAQALKPMPELAVFYGAGHLPTIERELCAALGYKPAEQKWFTGFSVSPATLNLSTNEFRLLRAFMHAQAQAEQKAMSQMNANAQSAPN